MRAGALPLSCPTLSSVSPSRPSRRASPPPRHSPLRAGCGACARRDCCRAVEPIAAGLADSALGRFCPTSSDGARRSSSGPAGARASRCASAASRCARAAGCRRCELRDVVLLDAEQREALRLPRVAAALSARSLLALELRFEQLLIDGAALEVRRDARRAASSSPASNSPASGARPATAARPTGSSRSTSSAVRHGRLRWIDEQRGAPPLELDAVDLVVRNGLRRHDLRLDATPPAAWGERFTLRGALHATAARAARRLAALERHGLRRRCRAPTSRELRRHVTCRSSSPRATARCAPGSTCATGNCRLSPPTWRCAPWRCGWAPASSRWRSRNCRAASAPSATGPQLRFTAVRLGFCHCRRRGLAAQQLHARIASGGGRG